MAFKGRINIREIEKNPVRLDATEKEAWVQELLERAAPSPQLTGLEPPDWASKCSYQVDLNLQAAGGTDFSVEGSFKAKVPAPCSRCADLFDAERAADFRLILHRLVRGEEEMAQEDSGDPDYLFLANDEIDLSEILAEQIVIQEPVAECPARKVDGSCSLCGKNPQFAGQGSEKKADSPFAKLGSLKIKE